MEASPIAAARLSSLYLQSENTAMHLSWQMIPVCQEAYVYKTIQYAVIGWQDRPMERPLSHSTDNKTNLVYLVNC